MKILLNTPVSMTGEILAFAVAGPATENDAQSPQFGSVAIDSAAESYLAAAGVMDIAVRACGWGITEVAVVILELKTSKAGGYARGPPNPRTFWPLSSALGLDL